MDSEQGTLKWAPTYGLESSNCLGSVVALIPSILRHLRQKCVVLNPYLMDDGAEGGNERQLETVAANVTRRRRL